MLSLLFMTIFTIRDIIANPQRHEDHVFQADDIIELPVGRFPDPDCEYSVLRNGPYGPKVNNEVRVGDVIFHSWKCSYGVHDSSMYCLMVNNCTVSSERESSEKVPILDEFGCSLFPNILPHVEYASDLNGGMLVSAFSLDVDQAAVFFECNVKLLLKLNGVCRRPTCPSLDRLRGDSVRFRRHIRSERTKPINDHRSVLKMGGA
ncbi:hypothetical protein DICVIV_02504 [Dictyocaulus viviparus]|uniref:ZP domain-containing protein n=1 Tax=Dictyocaulus viviparus TaxID=29172 RepID=A0A0D8Y9R0_DICVI|nr:hypothetical protein DICVIV_02504 [Dictyocaulus viviparus]